MWSGEERQEEDSLIGQWKTKKYTVDPVVFQSQDQNQANPGELNQEL